MRAAVRDVPPPLPPAAVVPPACVRAQQPLAPAAPRTARRRAQGSPLSPACHSRAPRMALQMHRLPRVAVHRHIRVGVGAFHCTPTALLSAATPVFPLRGSPPLLAARKVPGPVAAPTPASDVEARYQRMDPVQHVLLRPGTLCLCTTRASAAATAYARARTRTHARARSSCRHVCGQHGATDS